MHSVRKAPSTPHFRSVEDQQCGPCGQRRGSIIPVAKTLIPRMVCLALLLPCSITDAAALDLSLPKDLAGEDRLHPMPEQGDRREGQSAAMSLYTDNVKETIKRRLRDSFPRDSVGRVICGEASYAMTLRPDGSIDRLEVVPARQEVESSGDLESYFVQPTPAFRNAGSAKYSRPVATDKEDLRVFAQTIAALLRGIAPFAAQPKPENVPNGQNGLQYQVPLALVSGSIGVKCRHWEVSQ